MKFLSTALATFIGFAVWSQQLQWVDQNIYPGSIASGIALHNTDVYIAGSITDWNHNTGYYNRYFISKYDSSGALLWTDSIGAHNGPQSAGVVCDKNGNAYACIWTPGTNNSLVINSMSFPSGPKMLLVKYNSAGQKLWVANYPGWLEPTALVINTQDNIYITGKAGNGGF